MADTKRVIRRISPDKLADFDEQWWPITLLLLTSAGALAGYIYTSRESDFQTTVWYRSAWFQLGAVGVLALALVLGVAALRGSSQRRLQLGIFLSLAFHLGLIYFSRQTYLTYVEQPLPPAPEGLDDEVSVVIPDYFPAQTEGDTTAEITRPAESQLRPDKQVEVAPKPPEKMQAEKEAVAEPEPRKEPLPTPLEMARVELSAPRRNEMLSGIELSRKTITEPLPQEKAPQPKIERSAPTQQLVEKLASAAQQTAAEEAARRPAMKEPRPQAPSTAAATPAEPNRREAAQQLAMNDVRAQRDRRLTEALPDLTLAPRSEAPAAARPSLDGPRNSATVDAMAATARSTPSLSEAVAPQTTPSVTLKPGPMAAAQLTRAETPQPTDFASTAPPQNMPKRSNFGAVALGQESVAVESPAAPASAPSPNPGGAAMSLQPATVERGNQGSTEEAFAQGVVAPAALGVGAGNVVGSPFAGPQRAAAVGDGDAGQAAGVNPSARPGRGRATGTTSIAAEQVPEQGMAGNIGAANQRGNAAAGSSGDLRPTTVGEGASLGERMSAQQGPSLRTAPGGGTPGGLSGTAGAISGNGTAALGAATGDGSAASGQSVRREFGAGADSIQALGSSALPGRSGRGKLSASDGFASLVGSGPINMPQPGAVGGGNAAGMQGTGEARGSETAGEAVSVGRASTGVPVLIAAPEGPGGFTARPSRDIGLPSRRARPESDVAHLEINRLVPERLGGKKVGGGMVRDTAVTGLKQRDPTNRGEVARAMGGSEQTERAVEMGLDFLARHQASDGSWRLHDFGGGKPGYDDAGAAQMESNTAGTGLALLAFLGAGYTHRDAKYGDVVERGLGYLLRNQKADGDLFVPPPDAATTNTWLYSHGIASIALCEALGMSRDEELLKGPAQHALDFIVQAQNPQFGGWRYRPRLGSDTSVSGWQLMALKSGERVGLTVPSQTYDLVTRWLDFAQGIDGDPTRYAYRPQAREESPDEDFEHQRKPSRVMTAEALLMRQYLGWNRDNAYLTGGADYLLTQLPSVGTVETPDRDSYYWYYATQVMFHMKGDYWKRWNERLRPLLVDSQVREGLLAGSWNPGGEVPDRWGGSGGRIYTTTMHLLMLEVYYRYLPLYQNLE